MLCRIASKAFFFLHFSSNCGNKFLFNKFIAIKFVVIYEVDSGKTNHSCQTMDYENIFTNLPEQRIVKRESIVAFTVKNTYTRFIFCFLQRNFSLHNILSLNVTCLLWKVIVKPFTLTVLKKLLFILHQ